VTAPLTAADMERLAARARDVLRIEYARTFLAHPKARQRVWDAIIAAHETQSVRATVTERENAARELTSAVAALEAAAREEVRT